jgi:ribosomal protein S18 acetylase RimI-like enzyme
MNIRIKNVIHEDDIYLVHKIMLEAFEEYRHLDVPSSAIHEPLTSLKDSINKGLEKALLCTVNGIPTGSLRYKIEDHFLYFSRVSVKPEGRGKGIAKVMLNYLEEQANILEKNELRCRVRMSLPSNKNLYHSVGFKIEQEETVTNPNGFLVKTVLMKKTI